MRRVKCSLKFYRGTRLEFFNFANLWLAFPLSFLGFTLTLIGLKIAYEQVKKTATAADAAANAAMAATKSLSRNLTMLVVQQLVHIEREIDRAIREDERGVLLDYLGQWRFQAGQLHALVLKMGKDEAKLAQAIMTSITVCGRPKADINKPSTDLVETMRPTQNAVSKVSAELGRLTADGTIAHDITTP